MSAINLFTGESGDSYFGATGGRQAIYLEDDVIPVILLFGDSTAVGLSSTAAGSRDVWENTQGNAYPVEPGERTTYGYYWDQWLSISGTTLDRSQRVSTTPSGASWEKLFPHLGGNAGGDYKTDDGPDERQMTPLWSFAQDIWGLFRYADQTNAIPHFVTFGSGSATTGNNGLNLNSYAEGETFSNIAFDTYLVDAINNLTNENGPNKRVAFVGAVCMAGEADLTPVATMTNSTDVNLKAIRRYLENKFEDQTAFPWLQFDAYLPDESYVPGGGGTITKEAVRGLFNDIRKFVRTEECVSIFNNADIELLPDGVHPTALGNIQLGRKIAAQYRELLATNPAAAAPLITTTIA